MSNDLSELTINELWTRVNCLARGKQENYIALKEAIKVLVKYSEKTQAEDHWFYAFDSAGVWVSNTPMLLELEQVQTSNEDDEDYKRYIINKLLEKKLEL